MTRVSVSLLILGFCVDFVLAQGAIAIVNGRTITKKEFEEFLMESRGVSALQQMIAAELAEAEAKRRGFRVTDSDVQREFESSLERIFPVNKSGAQMSQQERLDALKQMLKDKGMTRAEYDLAMRRNVCLRRIVEADFKIDEDTLREVFARNYGERVQVRHIQIRAGNFSKLQAARDELEKGKDFEEVVAEFSENPESRGNGGLLEPFGYRDEEMPEILRQAAFSLKLNEVSKQPVQAGNMYHILKLERRIPPADVRFEDVREEVLAEVRDRNTVKLMNDKLYQLFQDANVRVLNGKLHRGYQEALQDAATNPLPATP